MISVIIPVYNTEQYLRRCMDSVLAASYQDFEVLLIDDGSTDGSEKICREYCWRDPRIRFFKQTHAGVSAARNRGIAECLGEWIVFIDSDDFISQNYFSLIMRPACQRQDLLIFEYAGYHKGDGKIKDKKISGRRIMPVFYGEADRIRFIRRFLKGRPLLDGRKASLLSSWAKAYRSSLIRERGLRFPEDLAVGEDRLFNLFYYAGMESCMYIPKTVYYAEVRSGSAMRGFIPGYLENDMRYQAYLERFLKDKHILEELSEEYYHSVLTNMADCLIRGIFNPKGERTYRENCKLCEAMQENKVYRQALSYNRKTGVIPRRILLFFFRHRCFCITKWICGISYRILERRKSL